MLSETDLLGELEPELDDEHEDEDELDPPKFSTSIAAKPLREADPVPFEFSLPPDDPLGE
nr:hypothetical protein Iba_scaffold2853CG0350 [Ipomoea batatas]